jgi:hypothetical protein
VIVENLPDRRGAGLAGAVADAHHLGADHAGRGAAAAKSVLYPNYGVSKVANWQRLSSPGDNFVRGSVSLLF